MSTTAPVDINYWKRELRGQAAGLDLTADPGRAAFRYRVFSLTRGTKVAVLRAVLRELGNKIPPTDRDGAMKSLANYWMLLDEDQRIPADEKSTVEQRRELANSIALLADAIAQGRLVGPERAAVTQLRDNVARLVAWTPDDRDSR